MPHIVGRQVGPYLLTARLGGGAMASVYRAVDQRSGTPVALKILLPDADETVRERFRLEAQTVSSLDHPHIVHTLEVSHGLDARPDDPSDAGYDRTFIAMELVEGPSLGDLLERVGALNGTDSCALLAPIAHALAYAHASNIVHRDVKPSNILLRRVAPGTPHSVRVTVLDDPVVPLLSDFGIARALDAPDLTSLGRTIGTPAYMSPEQCAGNREIDGRADLYALGAVFYRCLVGRPPYLGTTTQILYAHVYDPVTVPEEALRFLTPLQIEILRRSLAKEPSSRYAEALQMAEDLEVAGGRPLVSGLPSGPQEATGRPDPQAFAIDGLDGSPGPLATPADPQTMTMPDLGATVPAATTSSLRVIVPGSAAVPGAQQPPAAPAAPASVAAPLPVAQPAGGRLVVPPAGVDVPGAGLGPRAVVARHIPYAPALSAVELASDDGRAPGARRRGLLFGLLLAVPMVLLLGLGIAALLDFRLPSFRGNGQSPAASLVTPSPDAAAAVAFGSATPAVPTTPTAAPVPTFTPTPTATPGPPPTPVGDINQYWEDAQAFFEERDWDEALAWLTLVRRIDARFEEERVTTMFFEIALQMAARATARNDYSTAIQQLTQATTLRPQDNHARALLRATEALSKAAGDALPAARRDLQVAYASYGAELVRQERSCDAADFLETALTQSSTPQALDYAVAVRAECNALLDARADQALLESLEGQLLYSTQMQSGAYRIYRVEASPEAESHFLVDSGRQPSLAQDGIRLAFHSARPDAQGLAGFDLSSGLDPGERSVLYTRSPGDAADSPPSWNLEHSRLVFASVDPADSRSRLYTLWVDSADPPSLLTFGQSPAWSWAGDIIAYNGVSPSGEQPGLWLIRPDGTGAVPLTDNGTDIRPAWAPDGSSVVFMSNARSGDWDVFRVSLPEGIVTQLTTDPAQDGLPTISPDGRFVAYVSDRGGSWNIWVQPIDGGKALFLTAIEGSLTNWLEHNLQWIP